MNLHIPGYHYCGPGNLKQRLSRNDPGINLFDKACKEHDIAYANTKIATIGVKGTMKIKRKLGIRLKKKS